MKKLIPILLSAVLLIPQGIFAQGAVGVDTGIQNDISYQEVVFVTGKPVLLTGTVKVTEKEKNGQRTEKYTYKLENAGSKAKMTRTASFITTLYPDSGQTREVTELESFKESIDIDGKKFETDDEVSKMTKSQVTHQKPAVDYFAGDYKIRKVYDVDKGKGEMVVDVMGNSVGYEQYWGATETRTIQAYVDTQAKPGQTLDKSLKINGTYEVKLSYNRTRDIDYMSNQPNQISFRGGYMMNSKEDSVLEYSYDLNNKTGRGSFNLKSNPKYERLLIPELRDISGHWAENDIKMLASLKAFQPNKSFFGPNLPIKRSEFAQAVATVCDIVVEDQPKTRTSRKKQEDPSIYADLPKADQSYKYVKSVTDKGIMFGVGEDQFDPEGTLDRAQAVSIIIRALGFEGLAPIQRYSTGFRDEMDIPYWAKDSVYVANELGLVTGTENGYFQPEKSVTRAEAAKMLSTLVNYLRKDLKEDYRERILNY